MSSLNLLVLIGNLTRDPELKYIDGGKCVAKCGVAVNETWKDNNGAKHEEVTFVDFECWGRTAEVLNEFCKKGKKVCLRGKLKLDQWDDRETGQKRSKLKMVLDQYGGLVMLGGQGDGEGGGGGGGDHRTQSGGQQRPQGGGNQGRDPEPQGQGIDFDDIPFAFLISCIMGIGSAIMGA